MMEKVDSYVVIMGGRFHFLGGILTNAGVLNGKKEGGESIAYEDAQAQDDVPGDRVFARSSVAFILTMDTKY